MLTDLASTEGIVLLVLLCAGHTLADFVFQTRAMVEGKRQARRPLLLHGVEVGIVQAVVITPFFFDHGIALLVCTLIALAHVVVDRGKVLVEQRFGERLRWFGIDQALHAATLVLVASFWLALSAPPTAGPWRVDPAPLYSCGLIVSAYAIAINGGSSVVSAVLRGLRSEDDDEPGGSDRAGRTIGILERLVVVTLVWLGEWGALGFILAAKSIARFKELDDRRFAEAYLVGTLTSLLVAGALGVALRLLLI